MMRWSDGCYLYPSQTKILKGLTKDAIQIFDTPFKGASTLFGVKTLKSDSKTRSETNVCSAFQNLRLGGVKFVR